MSGKVTFGGQFWAGQESRAPRGLAVCRPCAVMGPRAHWHQGKRAPYYLAWTRWGLRGPTCSLLQVWRKDTCLGWLTWIAGWRPDTGSKDLLRAIPIQGSSESPKCLDREPPPRGPSPCLPNRGPGLLDFCLGPKDMLPIVRVPQTPSETLTLASLSPSFYQEGK